MITKESLEKKRAVASDELQAAKNRKELCDMESQGLAVKLFTLNGRIQQLNELIVEIDQKKPKKE